MSESRPEGDFASAAQALAALGSRREAGLTSAEAAARLDRWGPNEVPEPRAHPLRRLLGKFWGVSAWMLETIAALSWALGKLADLGVALALLLVNASLSFLQEQHASSAVAALRRRLQVTARVLRDGAWGAVPARALVRGDVVRLRPGDFVPADVLVVEGALRIDQSTLTGETSEVEKRADDRVHSGSTVRGGEATAVVVATGTGTWFGRTTHLVQSAHPRLHLQEVVGRVVRWLLLVVGAAVAVMVAVALAKGIALVDLLPLALVVLMSAVPVALPVMFTVSAAVGSMRLARQGVLVSELRAVEDAASMDVLCADKTGTLTLNRLVLVAALPQPGRGADDVLLAGALASHEADQDPIDLAFLRAARERGLLGDTARTLAFVPFSPETRRTEALVEVGGRKVRVVKGALRTVATAAGLDSASLAALEERATREAARGIRSLGVARAEGEGPLAFLGTALLEDALRPDSAGLVARLRGLGVGVKMLTGDALPAAREIGARLGLAHVVRASEAAGGAGAEAPRLVDRADGLAEMFPEDKFAVVRALQAAGHVVGMTGDGVNDAPALRQAEVGIAVTGATDVAKGAATCVLTTEGLSGIVDLVEIGRATYQRILTWVLNKVSRTVLKAGVVVVAFLATGRLVISALGMVLLVFLTDFAKISLATDRVPPSARPQTWRVGALVRVAVVLGLLMLVEVLGLLAVGGPALGLGRTEGTLENFTFQALLFFALFSILSVRERGAFWRSRPSAVLAASLSADAVLGLAIALGGLGDLRPLPPLAIGLVVAVAAASCLGLNDLVKCRLFARASASPRE